MVASASELAELAGQWAVKGELRAQDRLAIAYAQGDADRNAA